MNLIICKDNKELKDTNNNSRKIISSERGELNSEGSQNVFIEDENMKNQNKGNISDIKNNQKENKVMLVSNNLPLLSYEDSTENACTNNVYSNKNEYENNNDNINTDINDDILRNRNTYGSSNLQKYNSFNRDNKGDGGDDDDVSSIANKIKHINIANKEKTLKAINNQLEEEEDHSPKNKKLEDKENESNIKSKFILDYLYEYYNNQNIIINDINNLNSRTPKVFENNYKMCFICEKLFNIEYIFRSDDCEHYFCKKCGKLFYEEKIEQGFTNLKCPYFKCKSLISKEKLRLLISNQHYKVINNNRNTKLKEIIKNKVDLQNKIHKDNNIDNKIKSYLKKNVIDISTNEGFYKFNKAKIQFCPICKKDALFSNKGTFYIKCLNCNEKICKYCFKIFDLNHLDINSPQQCKICFRRNEKYDKKSYIYRLFLFELMVIISSYLILFFALFKYAQNFFDFIFCYNRNKLFYKNKCFISKIILIFIFSLTCLIVGLPFFIIILPYFPLFTLIF